MPYTYRVLTGCRYAYQVRQKGVRYVWFNRVRHGYCFVTFRQHSSEEATHPFPSKASGDGDARRVPISKRLVLSLLASLRLPYVLVRRDGRKEGVEQVLPIGLRSGPDSEAEAAEEPADEGADDASHEHSLRHLQQLHLQRYQVQLPQGRSQTYLGIRIFRFYFKCTKCSAELTIKTDPQNSDYVVESGASRNFEPWRAKDEEADTENQKRETEEMGDAMKSLENRTLDSKREMDILAALDEVKSMRSRRATIKVDAMLEILQRSAKEKAPREVVRRIDDDILDDDEDLFQISTDNAKTSNNNSKRRKVSEELPTNRFLKNFPLSQQII
ncbi:hypothetical protein TEA_009881 [Camellia sinensis var. sinensis]|uniref:Splicing factor YJU2 n=1 Tax=Camellia sinensis var. sinensis TaxID=542762 RepID=A0A4V3WPB6_CAMSN|nr:hypothetical protein TEA_009881 [Camellia sinensis var. sinensis]